MLINKKKLQEDDGKKTKNKGKNFMLSKIILKLYKPSQDRNVEDMVILTGIIEHLFC